VPSQQNDDYIMSRKGSNVQEWTYGPDFVYQPYLEIETAKFSH